MTVYQEGGVRIPLESPNFDVTVSLVVDVALKDKELYRSYMNTYMKERYKQRRLDVISRLSGKCKHCESTENLQLDHINPTSKYKSIAKLSSASDVIFEAEIKKCQLLCKDCHLEKTIAEGSLGDRYRECICDCGRVFGSIKSYAGHKSHCK